MYGRESVHVVAGLDLSLTSSGIAIRDKQGWHTYSVGISLKKPKEKDQIARIIRVVSRIMVLLKKHQVEAVIIEGYAFSRNSRSSTRLAELGGVVKTQLLSSMKIVPIIVPCSQARKFLLGKDDRDKSTVATFLRQMGYTFSTNDESDALCLAVLLDVMMNRDEKHLSEHQIETLRRIRDDL